MKRGREEGEADRSDMAKCWRVLCKVGETKAQRGFRVKGGFKCKSCNREFSSFQALGGHRASHMKPTLRTKTNGNKKTHDCHICGLQFGIGQALGGHMRKHRDAAAAAAPINDVALMPKPDNSTPGIDLLSLDLNLTPFENGLKLHLRPPLLYCFI